MFEFLWASFALVKCASPKRGYEASSGRKGSLPRQMKSSPRPRGLPRRRGPPRQGSVRLGELGYRFLGFSDLPRRGHEASQGRKGSSPRRRGLLR